MASIGTFTTYQNLIGGGSTSPGANGNIGTIPNSNPLLYVPHQELAAGIAGGPEEFMGDNAHAQRVLRCYWQDRLTLAWQLLGGPIQLGAAGNPSASAVNSKWGFSLSTGDFVVMSPHAYPYNPLLFCQSVSIKPSGRPLATNAHWDSRINSTNVPVPATVNNFDHAILTCDYVSPQEYIANGTGYGMFFKEQLSPCTEFITCPRNNLYWDNAASVPINVNEAPAFEIKRWIWTVKRRKITPTGTLLAQVAAAQGCVNTDTLVSNFFGSWMTAGHVLFEGATMEPDSLNDGTPAVAMELKFKVSNVLWNQFPHVGAGGSSISFDKIYNADGTQFKMYPTTALGPLISSAYW